MRQQKKNLKGEWVILGGIEITPPYRIAEGMGETYAFVFPASHKGKIIQAS